MRLPASIGVDTVDIMSLFVRTYRGARSGHKQRLADAAPAARDDRRHERLKTCHENMS